MDKTTFIFLYRDDIKRKNTKSYRLDNLVGVLRWIKKYFPDDYQKMDILIVEQDDKPKLLHKMKDNDELKDFNIRHKFLFNPKYFNRGWGFNVGVKDYTDREVVVLADTDILILPSIRKCIQKILDGEVDVVSPYNAIYVTEEEERDRILKEMDYSWIDDIQEKTSPSYTIFGGLCCISRKVYLELGGFEEYNGYGYEDRAFDAVSRRVLGEERVIGYPKVNLHLYHPKVYFSLRVRNRTALIKKHCLKKYGCRMKVVKKGEDIHKNCEHKSREEMELIVKRRRLKMGDPKYYTDYPDSEVISTSE